LLFLAFLPELAIAADATTSQPANNTLGSWLFVAFGIAYLTRRRAIGGWLFYYYLQLYGSFLVSLVFLPSILSNLNPAGWDTNARYTMFLLSTVPVLVMQYTEVISASVLLKRRNEPTLRFLRVILIGLAIASGAAFAIDAQYFPESVPIDGLTLFFAVIWSVYLFVSKRVKSVFIENSWAHRDAVPARTRAEWRHVFKRAALVALLTSS
jgi:hypothetical protein